MKVRIAHGNTSPIAQRSNCLTSMQMPILSHTLFIDAGFIAGCKLTSCTVDGQQVFALSVCVLYPTWKHGHENQGQSHQKTSAVLNVFVCNGLQHPITA